MHSAEWVQFFSDGSGRNLLLRVIVLAYRAAFVVRTTLNSSRERNLDRLGGSMAVRRAVPHKPVLGS